MTIKGLPAGKRISVFENDWSMNHRTIHGNSGKTTGLGST